MRKVLFILVIVSILTAGLAATASAAGTPLPPLVAGFMLQNRSTANDASIVIGYYDTNGTVVQSVPDTIIKGGTKAYFVPNVQGLPDGRYSAVVLSSESLFSIVNLNTASGSSPFVMGSYNGFSDTDAGSPLFLPWITAQYYGGYNSMFTVQNSGGAASDIVVEFYQSGQSSLYKTYTFPGVKPGAAVYLDMNDAPYKTDLGPSPALPNGFFGGVKVYTPSNAQPLAAAINDTNPTGSMLRSWNAVKTGATDLIAPQIDATFYNYDSGLSIQNPNGSDANVTVKFYAAGSTSVAATKSFIIPANSVAGFLAKNVTGMPTNFIGSATIHSTLPVLGIANVSNPAGPASAYNLVPTTEAATTLYMPQVNRHFYNYETGYMLYNTGPEAVTVQIVFTNSNTAAGTVPSATITHNIPAGAPLAYFLGDNRGDTLGSNFNGGAVATVTSGNGKLIGITNFRAPNTGDNERTYNMFHN